MQPAIMDEFDELIRQTELMTLQTRASGEILAAWVLEEIAPRLKALRDRIAPELHQLALVEADMARLGWTDASTPLFQRVRNLIESSAASRANSSATFS